MKVRVGFKTPDAAEEAVRDELRGEVERIEGLDADERQDLLDVRVESELEKLNRWIEYDEWIEIDFDTAAGTATVVERE